jgi:hypothetical protein
MSERKGKAEPLTVHQKPDESLARALARTAVRPTLQAAWTEKYFLQGDFPDASLDELTKELWEQCDAVQRGDLRRAEEMLTTQAHTLDQIFNKLARTSYLSMRSNLDAAERLMRLALKAQTQSRATWETLGSLKNPPVVITNQANVTTGPQLINNGVVQTRETQSEQSRLLEQTHGERLDTRATGEAVGINSAMEAVGAIDRTPDC